MADPATVDLRSYMARPFLLDGERLAAEGLPVAPGCPAPTPGAALDDRLAAGRPMALRSYNPGTAAALEVPIGTRLAQTGTAPTRPDWQVPDGADHLLHMTDFRAPEPASLLLLLTGVIGLAARRHLLRQRRA